jgi:hypothetical protein
MKMLAGRGPDTQLGMQDEDLKEETKSNQD